MSGEQEQEPTRGEQEPKQRPRVWIASLSDYNAGRLHGAWVHADQELDGIWNGINEVLATSSQPGAEEWAIHDYEGFGPLRLSEYESVERISRLGLGIAEHGEAFAAFASFFGIDEEELLSQFEDCYLGQWESAEAYVDDYLESTGIEPILDEVVPRDLRPYIKFDTEALVRDMEFDGSVLSVEGSEGGVFLFHPP
jgi:antirestriction protein